MNIALWILSTIDPIKASGLSGFRISTLMSWAEGRALPSARSLNKLESVYRTFQYGELYKAGFSPSRAMEYAQYSPATVNKYSKQMDAYTRFIAQTKGVSESIIKRSMQLSDKPIEHYDNKYAITMYEKYAE